MLKPNDLPDFEAMLMVASEIRDRQIERDLIKDLIEKGKEKVHRSASTTGGKTPSTASIKASLEYSGIDGELIPLRIQLINLDAEVDFLQRKFDLMKMQVSIYQTESANKRATLL